MLNLFWHELKSRRTAILGWGIGLALFGAMYIALYPQMGNQLSALNSIPIYKTMGISLDTFAGYLASTVVQFTPVMLVIYVVIASTATLAGEEDSGTLELIATLPLSRKGIITMKATALALSIALILIIASAGRAIVFAFMASSIETDITATQLFISVMTAWPLLIAFLMIGLFLGAYLPNRKTASMTLTIIVLISYFGKLISISVQSLESLKPLFLFTHFESSAKIFTQGIQAEGMLILLATAAVFFVLAMFSFERRDITVGLWPWQNAKKT